MNLRGQGGYAMAALLVALAVMSVMLAVAMPVWKTAARREKEEELVFRGEQYARALMLYQRQVANAAPPSIDLLVQQHFLRKKYKDPITNDDFAILNAGSPALNGSADDQAGRGGAGRGGSASPPQSSGGLTGSGGTTIGGAIVGVTSKSKDESLRLYNGRNHYNEWVFTPTQRTQTPGAPGAPTTAALPGAGGQPAGRGGQRGGGTVQGQPFGGGRFGPRGGAAPSGRGGPGPLGVRPGGLPPEAPQRPQPPPG